MRGIIGLLVGAWAGGMLVATVGGWIWFMTALDNFGENIGPTQVVSYITATVAGTVIGAWLGHAAGASHGVR